MRFKLNRWLILALASLALLTLILLAAGLSNLQFKPAERYFTLPDISADAFGEVGSQVQSMSLTQLLILFGGLAVMFTLLMLLLSPEARKKILKIIFQLALLTWVFLWLAERYPRAEPLSGDAASQAAAASEGLVEQAPPVFVVPTVPAWFSYLVSLLVMVVLFVLAWRFWQRRRPTDSPLVELERAARSALDDISAGKDWEDVVIQCYARMDAAVSKQRGLKRKEAMTPSEFARQLERAGLPADPVRRLTRLFEKIRYGGGKSSVQEANEAVSCLSAIVRKVEAQ